MGKSLWIFEGYETDARNHPVQDWYFSALSVDERDLIRDRVNHLKEVERHLWQLPSFGPAGDSLWEIRRDTASGWIRMYGIFHLSKRHCFVFLNGNDKNARNDKKGKDVARERLKLLKRGIGGTHEFEFEERILREDSKGSKDKGSIGSIKPLGGYRFPN
jgi:hypothetical protein